MKLINNDERKEKFKTLALNKQMTFSDKDEFGTISYLKTFRIFNYRTGKIYNLCRYKCNDFLEETYLMDYIYFISNGKTRNVFRQTVFFVNSKKLGLPQFKMRPENLGDKIASFLGWKDIDFVQYPSFSDNYHLKGEDEDLVRNQFNEQVLHYFTSHNGWSVEACNYYLIFYRLNKLIHHNALFSFYDQGMQVYELFKNANQTHII